MLRAERLVHDPRVVSPSCWRTEKTCPQNLDRFLRSLGAGRRGARPNESMSGAAQLSGISRHGAKRPVASGASIKPGGARRGAPPRSASRSMPAPCRAPRRAVPLRQDRRRWRTRDALDCRHGGEQRQHQVRRARRGAPPRSASRGSVILPPVLGRRGRQSPGSAAVAAPRHSAASAASAAEVPPCSRKIGGDGLPMGTAFIHFRYARPKVGPRRAGTEHLVTTLPSWSHLLTRGGAST
jgi:hypothetical protein